MTVFPLGLSGASSLPPWSLGAALVVLGENAHSQSWYALRRRNINHGLETTAVHLRAGTRVVRSLRRPGLRLFIVSRPSAEAAQQDHISRYTLERSRSSAARKDTTGTVDTWPISVHTEEVAGFPSIGPPGHDCCTLLLAGARPRRSRPHDSCTGRSIRQLAGLFQNRVDLLGG